MLSGANWDLWPLKAIHLSAEVEKFMLFNMSLGEMSKQNAVCGKGKH